MTELREPSKSEVIIRLTVSVVGMFCVFAAVAADKWLFVFAIGCILLYVGRFRH